MTPDLLTFMWPVFAVFCRIGTATMLLPGFSSPRFPSQVRLLMALAVSFGLTPFVQGSVPAISTVPPDGEMVAVILSEVAVGLSLGFWSSCFVQAVRFAGTFVSNAIGLAGIPGQPVDEHEASNPIGSILALAAGLFIIASELHLLSLVALARSYEQFPLAGLTLEEPLLAQTVSVLDGTFKLALRISSPFVVFSIVVNLALGLTGRFTPQLQVYFAALGMVTLGGLVVLALLAPQLVSLFGAHYAAWLESGFAV